MLVWVQVPHPCPSNLIGPEEVYGPVRDAAQSEHIIIGDEKEK